MRRFCVCVFFLFFAWLGLTWLAWLHVPYIIWMLIFFIVMYAQRITYKVHENMRTWDANIDVYIWKQQKPNNLAFSCFHSLWTHKYPHEHTSHHPLAHSSTMCDALIIFDKQIFCYWFSLTRYKLWIATAISSRNQFVCVCVCAFFSPSILLCFSIFARFFTWRDDSASSLCSIGRTLLQFPFHLAANGIQFATDDERNTFAFGIYFSDCVTFALCYQWKCSEDPACLRMTSICTARLMLLRYANENAWKCILGEQGMLFPFLSWWNLFDLPTIVFDSTRERKKEHDTDF